MHPIDETTRRKLFALSAALCALSLLLAPIAGESSVEIAPEREIGVQGFAVPAIHEAPKPAALVIGRDPFAGNQHGAATHSPGAGIVGLRVTQGAPTGIDLPAVAIVRAIVRGSAGARALIEEGGRVRIVSAGDRVAGSKIQTITPDGILLTNGLRLPLDLPR